MVNLTNPVRIGVQLAPQHSSYANLRDRAVQIEDLGADILFNWDHFFPLSGDKEGAHFESWMLLAAWAERTERIELGPLVSCSSYRNADLQADMARTIDHISDGRFILGTGSGWFERDFDEYGYPFGTPGERLNILAADLPRIEARLAQLNPAPLRKIPVLIGGGGEKKTLKIVANHADIWHSFSDAETLARKLGILGDWCTEVGRNIDEIEVSVELRGRTEEDADALYAAGARLFTIGVSEPNLDFGPPKKWLAWRDAKNAG